jgi:cytochrome c551/c552
MKKAALWVVAILILIQLVPYGRDHTNPPVTQEPKWDSPQTQELVKRACFNCHSNETVWPWYSDVAPVSWLTQRDVNEGREHLNFSEWDKPQRHAKDVAAQVQSGEMPPWFYRPMHPEAKLTDADKQALIDGAAKTLGTQEPSRQ